MRVKHSKRKNQIPIVVKKTAIKALIMREEPGSSNVTASKQKKTPIKTDGLSNKETISKMLRL